MRYFARVCIMHGLKPVFFRGSLSFQRLAPFKRISPIPVVTAGWIPIPTNQSASSSSSSIAAGHFRMSVYGMKRHHTTTLYGEGKVNSVCLFVSMTTIIHASSSIVFFPNHLLTWLLKVTRCCYSVLLILLLLLLLLHHPLLSIACLSEIV